LGIFFVPILNNPDIKKFRTSGYPNNPQICAKVWITCD